MRRLTLPAVIAALVAVMVVVALTQLVHHSSGRFTLAKTQDCLTSAGRQAVSVPDPALPATGGHLKVTLITGFGDIYMAFGRDATEAVAIRDRAVKLAQRSLAAHHAGYSRSEIIAGTRMEKNVFYYSSLGAVSQQAAQLIDPCLS